MYIYANNANICIHIYLSISVLCVYIIYVCLCIYMHTCIHNIGKLTYIYLIHIYRERYIDICIHENIQVTIKTSDFMLQNK